MPASNADWVLCKQHSAQLGCQANVPHLQHLPSCRYASYCANVARTYFVDPSKEQEAQYAALQEAQAAAVAALVEGAPMSAAYEAVVATLKARRAPLLLLLLLH